MNEQRETSVQIQEELQEQIKALNEQISEQEKEAAHTKDVHLHEMDQMEARHTKDMQGKNQEAADLRDKQQRREKETLEKEASD